MHTSAVGAERLEALERRTKEIEAGFRQYLEASLQLAETIRIILGAITALEVRAKALEVRERFTGELELIAGGPLS